MPPCGQRGGTRDRETPASTHRANRHTRSGPLGSTRVHSGPPPPRGKRDTSHHERRALAKDETSEKDMPARRGSNVALATAHAAGMIDRGALPVSANTLVPKRASTRDMRGELQAVARQVTDDQACAIHQANCSTGTAAERPASRSNSSTSWLQNTDTVEPARFANSRRRCWLCSRAARSFSSIH